MPKGKFIVFSGGEGSGKTSVIARLKAENALPNMVYTREPGGTPLGEAQRAVLLDPKYKPVHWNELFQFMGIRAQHVAELIEPTLSQGINLLTDRYLEDTGAYQFYGRLRKESPIDLFNMADMADFPMPDRWYWYDVDPAEGLRRRRGTGEVNRLDDEALEFHQRVREGFSRLMRLNPYSRIGVRVDANRPFDEVYQEVKSDLLNFLKT